MGRMRSPLPDYVRDEIHSRRRRGVGKKYYAFLADYETMRYDRIITILAESEDDARRFFTELDGCYLVVVMPFVPFAKWLLGVNRRQLPRPKAENAPAGASDLLDSIQAGERFTSRWIG